MSKLLEIFVGNIPFVVKSSVPLTLYIIKIAGKNNSIEVPNNIPI
ncbi:NADH-ubiquinone/plastoquinone oxidoreductase family domain protein [Ehrlichia chaffeensis str. Heartland]|nr:NADH-ubiquinone/plastoquinone oxidoreductase family domain protein [Ehrlichia chaffeensis str. Heartland]AHX08938.1 NADH-ubiquinone/plastoquinone oxidoreductase family domain protein [Ehrlichia chaffeensis str. Saint Vincent]